MGSENWHTVPDKIENWQPPPVRRNWRTPPVVTAELARTGASFSENWHELAPVFEQKMIFWHFFYFLANPRMYQSYSIERVGKVGEIQRDLRRDSRACESYVH